jgi:predicted membrane protein
MDVRASDAERDAVIERLREAAAEGRLTMEELTDRIEAAAGARMRGELEALTADLPSGVAVAASDTRESAMGDVKRTGAWVVPAHSEFRSWTGSIKLDLRQATISSREIVIDAFTPFGTIDLLVPEGVQVEVRADKRMGTLKHQCGRATPGAPRVILTGGTVFGTIKVRNKRLWERWLKGG